MSAASLRARVSESLAWPRQASPKLRNVAAMLALCTMPSIAQITICVLRTCRWDLCHCLSYLHVPAGNTFARVAEPLVTWSVAHEQGEGFGQCVCRS